MTSPPAPQGGYYYPLRGEGSEAVTKVIQLVLGGLPSQEVGAPLAPQYPGEESGAWKRAEPGQGHARTHSGPVDSGLGAGTGPGAHMCHPLNPHSSLGRRDQLLSSGGSEAGGICLASVGPSPKFYLHRRHCLCSVEQLRAAWPRQWGCRPYLCSWHRICPLSS